jgi:hypothetical protein
MTHALDTRNSGPLRALRATWSALPRSVAQLRRDPPPENVAALALVLLCAVVTAAGIVLSRNYWPPSLLALPLLFGGLLLGRRGMKYLGTMAGSCLVLDQIDLGFSTPRVGVWLVVAITGLVAYEFARSREETGMGGLRADTMLVELRRRLELQGALAALSGNWRAETVVKPAGGGPFAGDFVVSALIAGRFEVVLADVSGKGVDAGTRSLLLSGALGGLMGHGDFLEAANAYLIRQDWDEGFATAVHLTVDLDTGAYSIGSAGHPPAAHFDAGSGRWSLVEASGPALGLIPDSCYDRLTGTLRTGDAVLLYTDGLVEVPGRDLSVGIDKLLGEAERLVPRGFAGGGEVLVNRVSAGSSDDRGLVLLWRS